MGFKLHPQHMPVHFVCRIGILFAIIVSLISCTSSAAHSFDKQQAAAELDAALETSVRDRDGAINRNVLLYIDSPTVDFSYAGAAGLARVDTGELMSADRPFMIASVAKTMVAVVIYQMAEEGAFGDQGVDVTLAELEVLPPEVMSDLHRMNGVSYANEITLRHLMTHTSGLRDVFFDGVDNPVGIMPGTAAGAAPDSLMAMAAFDKQYGLSALVDCMLDEIPAGCNPDDYLFRYPWVVWDYAAWQADPSDKTAGLLNYYLTGMNENAVGRPGEVFHYGDTNYLLLGLVIEKMSGNSLEHELHTRLFDPLGMDTTYLIGAKDLPDQASREDIAEVWAWDEPSMSGRVTFSFDWVNVISTLSELHTFARALTAGDLFQKADTLDDMFAVPEVEGLSYASGLIVFPTSNSQVIYMMGSNGTWVEYYPPLDLVMIGTINDFSDMSRQVRLHIQVCQILANHGLVTPMSRFTSLPISIVMACFVLMFILEITWLIGTLRARHKHVVVSKQVKQARWLVFLAFLGNLAMYTLIGLKVSSNPLQMLFGFSLEVRILFSLTAALMGLFAIAMTVYTVRLWRPVQGSSFDRSVLTVLAVVTLVYALSMGALG